MTVIDLILELCKYPAEQEVRTRSYRMYDSGSWGQMEYDEVEGSFLEEGYVIIE